MKTTLIIALQVKTSQMPLSIRRQKLAMAYWIHLGQRDDVREILNDCWETLNATAKGFAWKIMEWVKKDGLDTISVAPIVVISPIPLWVLAQQEVDVKLHENRKEKDEAIL